MNLGVIIDSDLNFNSHMNHVTKTAFFHLRNIARIRAYLSLDDAKTLIHAFVFSQLDCCNALFSGLPKKTTDRLQLVQNAAARVLTKTKIREHITPVLASLFLGFKIILLVYKALNGLAPSYLLDCLPKYVPTHPLRSTTADLLAFMAHFVLFTIVVMFWPSPFYFTLSSIYLTPVLNLSKNRCQHLH